MNIKIQRGRLAELIRGVKYVDEAHAMKVLLETDNLSMGNSLKGDQGVVACPLTYPIDGKKTRCLAIAIKLQGTVDRCVYSIPHEATHEEAMCVASVLVRGLLLMLGMNPMADPKIEEHNVNPEDNRNN